MMYEQVFKLKPDRLLVLKETLTNAALAFEMGTKPSEVFRRAKHKASVGIEHKLYRLLEKADKEQLEALSRAVEKEFSNVN